jgi:integrase
VAQGVSGKLQDLLNAVALGMSPDPGVLRWLELLSDDFHGKLADAGLVESRTPQAGMTLGAFLSEYIGGRVDVKASTRAVFERTRNHLLAHFGADKPLHAITEGDADAWRLYLVSQGLAPNTINRTSGIARQFFRAAVRRRLLRENPFAGLKTAVTGNKAREHFVSRQDAEKILQACPNTEWKLIFALARFGGLRTPSETLLLRWEDINWSENRMLVRSPKTEHHPGGESRLVPIFPELAPLLTLALAEAEPGPGFVIAKHRDTGANLRTYMLRILAKAGVKPWPKLFQNLRASRETELCETFPLHVVTSWLGNTARIAAKHYLQVTDEHFERAAERVRKTTRALHEPPCTTMQALPAEGRKNADLVHGDILYTTVQCHPVGGTGLEQSPLAPPKTPISSHESAQNYTPRAPDSPSDPDLAEIVRRWPHLHEAIRTRILALVQEAPDAR